MPVTFESSAHAAEPKPDYANALQLVSSPTRLIRYLHDHLCAAQQKATNDMSKIAYKPAKKDKDDKKPSKGGKGACGKAK
jgi:hypothetical protein